MDIPASSGFGTHQDGSVAMWVKVTGDPGGSNGAYHFFFGHMQSSVLGDGFGDHVDGMQEMNFSVTGSSGFAGLFQDGNVLGYMEENDPKVGGAYMTDPDLVEFGTSASITDGVWHHIAMTWDISGDAVIYIDGCEAARDTGVGTRTMLAPFHTIRIGRANQFLFDGFPRVYEGWMDEVYLFSRALSDCEVAALYEAGN
ncbi:MAG: LamG domain-containing protein [Pirellulales bacterium]|nr:LamG domain-containing protein [Pirellulales bacterium]